MRLARSLAHSAAWILRFGPRGFREQYGSALVGSFELMLDQEHRRRGVGPMLVLWSKGVADAIGTVGRERRLDREEHRAPLFRDLKSDIRSTLRRARRSPGFSLTIVLTLVLGLGLSSAIFAFADGYLFRPLPFPDSDRLYFVRVPGAQPVETPKATETAALRASAVGNLGFVEWGGGTAIVAGDLVIGDRRVSFRADGVSPGFAQVLRMPLELGRDFTKDDFVPSTPVPAWLSYAFWQREFGGDPHVVGRSLTTVGTAGPGMGRTSTISVVGIMSRNVTAFDLNNPPPDIVAPSVERAQPGPNALSFPLVRLPAEMSRAQAESAISAALEGVAPGPPGKPRRATLRSLYEYEVQGGRPTAQVFLTGAMLVLLLVTINVSHLFLTRGVVRAPEVVTRTALGASRWRIARTFLVESALTGGVGIAGGLVLGRWLASLIATSVPRFPTGARNLALIATTFDTRSIVFACILGFVISIVGGLWPAWRAVHQPLGLNARSAGGSGAALSPRVSQTILGSAVAVATVIMVGTVFMGLGIWRYLSQPLGFSLTDRFQISLETVGGGPPGAGAPWLDALNAVRQTPGVRAASVYWTRSASPVLIGDETKPRERLAGADVAAGYFDAWGSELVSGRVFSVDEFAAGAPLAVVDERFARIAWPAQDPIGQIVRVRDGQPRQVIGVIRLERRRLSVELEAQVYIPRQGLDRRELLVAFAPGLNADDLTSRLAGQVAQVLPNLRPVVKPLTFDTFFARDAGEAYFQRPVVVAFGLFAFALAGIGLFGLVLYLVEQRLRDYGIRLALGARRGDIWRQVARQGLLPASGGLVAGLIVSRLLEGIVQASVFGWQSSGLVAGLVVGVALLSIAIVAAIAPARRALRVDPIQVLRAE